MILRRTLLAGLLVFAVASCGGDNSSKMADVIEDISSDNEEMPDFEATGNSCFDAAQAFGLAISGMGMAATGQAFDIDEYRKNIELARKFIASEYRADFDIIADAYDEMAEVFARIAAAGGMSTEAGMEEMMNADINLDDEKLNAAAQRISEYYTKDCLKFYGG